MPNFLETLPADYPNLARHAQQHLTPSRSHEGEGEFEFGFDLILDGFEKLRDASG